MVKTGMKVAIKTEPANAEKKKLQHEKEVLSQLRGTPGIPKVSTRIIAEGPCARTRSLSTHPRNSEELSSARGAHVRRSSRQPCTRETTSTGAKRAVGSRDVVVKSRLFQRALARSTCSQRKARGVHV